MDKEKLNLVVLAGLLHDVGKFFERGEIFSESRKDETCLGFCPSDKKGGFHTHLHCAHTKFFCDYLDERFACLRTMPSKDWKTWSSGHHLSDEQSLESKVIRLADRLSSSEREEGQYYQRGIGQRTLLEPILEKVFLQSNQDRLSTSYRYPLTRLNSDEESLFPKLWKDFDEELEFSHDAHKGLDDPKKWSHLLCKTSLKGGYEALCNSFLDDVNALSEKSPDIALGDLTVCLNSILERYTSNVPSASNVRHPDISLYDHMRTTASIAQALYVQQMKQDNPLANLEVENDPKWLLACGDFSGIQKFIYNLTNRGAARGLRGRSYYVQLFCQLSCRYILRKLSLNSAALLYDSGGRFYILLPSCMKKDLLKARGDINAWLLKKFGGSVYLGLGVAPVTAGMFAQGNMHEAWKEAAENLERDRSQKFMECFSDLEFFEPQIEFDPTKSCPVCGSKEVSRSVKCSLCEDLESLGIWLRDTEAVLTLWDREASDRISSLLSTTRKISFDGLGADAIMVSRRDLSLLSSIKSSQTECLFLNEVGEQSIASLDLPKTGMAVQFSYLGKWDLRRQMDEDKPWDFDRYAAESKGIKRLGILRMDVDNLGLVFIQGLRFPKRESLRIDDRDIPGWGEVVLEKSITQRKSMASISRMTTLSRQLKNFFSGFLVNLLKQEDFDKCQIIYSGGDDLFIIGSWHQLPGLDSWRRAGPSQKCLAQRALAQYIKI